ncbi:MAG: NAD-dependent dihydroorotate dehydrogenase B electron transfer subunit, partial [Firmicutes bacterium]|nr:NAD-dependent dihydroorotate dehydrogenase B electron transfer subunit [Bacillota bacterium]
MPKKMMMEIIEHKEVARHVYRLVLAGKTAAKPGQFVQVGVSSSHDPFLKRPLSVHNCSDETLTLL